MNIVDSLFYWLITFGSVKSQFKDQTRNPESLISDSPLILQVTMRRSNEGNLGGFVITYRPGNYNADDCDDHQLSVASTEESPWR